METQNFKKMFKESNRDLQMDIILYVASANEEPNKRLFEVIQEGIKFEHSSLNKL